MNNDNQQDPNLQDLKVIGNKRVLVDLKKDLLQQIPQKVEQGSQVGQTQTLGDIPISTNYMDQIDYIQENDKDSVVSNLQKESQVNTVSLPDNEDLFMKKPQDQAMQKPEDYADPDKLDQELISGSINEKVQRSSQQEISITDDLRQGKLNMKSQSADYNFNNEKNFKLTESNTHNDSTSLIQSGRMPAENLRTENTEILDGQNTESKIMIIGNGTIKTQSIPSEINNSFDKNQPTVQISKQKKGVQKTGTNVLNSYLGMQRLESVDVKQWNEVRQKQYIPNDFPNPGIRQSNENYGDENNLRLSNSGERNRDSRSGSKFKQSLQDSSKKIKENLSDLQSVNHDPQISKRISLEQAQQEIAKKRQEIEQQRLSKNRSMIMKNKNINQAYNMPNSIFNKDVIKSVKSQVSSKSHISQDVYSTHMGMIGASSKLQPNSQPQTGILGTSSSYNRVPINHTSELIRGSKISGRNASQKYITAIGQPTKNKEYQQMKESILYGKKLNQVRLDTDAKSLENQDEILDKILKNGKDHQMRSSQSSSVLQTNIQNNDMLIELAKMNQQQSLLVNEYGQGSASHHFLMNQYKENKSNSPNQISQIQKKQKQMAHGKIKINQLFDINNNYQVTNSSRSKQKKLREKKSKNYMDKLKQNGDKQGNVSNMGFQQKSSLSQIELSEENIMAERIMNQSQIEYSKKMPPTQNENIFMSNLQKNILKRPTSMPNVQYDKKIKKHGQVYREYYRESEGLQDTDQSTQNGVLKTQMGSQKRWSKMSQQLPLSDNMNITLLLDQQRAKIEYLTNLNHELLKERKQELGGRQKEIFGKIGSISFDRLPTETNFIEPYSQIADEMPFDEFISRKSQKNIQGAININQFISSKKGNSKFVNNERQLQNDRQGLQTQHGNFFNKGRQNETIGEIGGNNEKIYNDLNEQSYQVIRQSIPVMSKGLNNALSGGVLPTLNNLNSRNKILNDQVYKLAYQTNNSMSENPLSLNFQESSKGLEDGIPFQLKKFDKAPDHLTIDLKAGLREQSEEIERLSESQDTQKASQVYIDIEQNPSIPFTDDQNSTLNKKSFIANVGPEISLQDSEVQRQKEEQDEKTLKGGSIDRDKEDYSTGNIAQSRNPFEKNTNEDDKENQSNYVIQKEEPPQITIFDNEILQNGKRIEETSDKVDNTQNVSYLTHLIPINNKQQQPINVSKALLNIRVKVTDNSEQQMNNSSYGVIDTSQLTDNQVNKRHSNNRTAQQQHNDQNITNPTNLNNISKIMMDSQSSFMNKTQVTNISSTSALNKKQKKEVFEIKRLNQELNRFKLVIEEQEQEHLVSRKPMDGINNLNYLICNVLQPRLGDTSPLPQLLKQIHSQVQDKIYHLKQEQDRQMIVMENQVISEKENYQKYKDLSIKLQEQINYDKDGLNRFLKQVGKDNVLSDIKEFEALGQLNVSELLIAQGRINKGANNSQMLQENTFERSTQYSGLNKDLKSQLILLNARGNEYFSEEQLDEIGQMVPKNADEEVVVQKVQDALLFCFSNLQATTAKQVLQRCIKQVIQRDVSTQMGVDMFEEERNAFQTKLQILNEQVHNLTHTRESLTNINKRLMSDKADQSRQARSAKEKLETLQRDLQQITLSLNQKEDIEERLTVKINEKNIEVNNSYDKIEQLRTRIEGLKTQKEYIKASYDDEKERTKQLQKEIDSFDIDQQMIKSKLQLALSRLRKGMVRQTKKIIKPKTGKIFKESADDDTQRTKKQDKTENDGTEINSSSEETVYESGESYYINYKELIIEKNIYKTGDQNENSGDQSDSFDPQTTNLNGFEVLTSEEYFKMADSIGLLDLDADNPTKMTEEDAQAKIDKWFAGLNRKTEAEDSDEVKQLQKEYKTKKAMAKELMRRISAIDAANVMLKLKTSKIEDDSRKSAQFFNQMSDEEKDKFMKNLDSSVGGSIMTNERLSQINKSNKKGTIEQSRFENEEKNISSPNSGVKVENDGRASVGETYGWAHFDADHKPLVNKKSGQVIIYDDDGKQVISTHDLLEQSNMKSPNGNYTPNKFSGTRTPSEIEREAMTEYDLEMKKKQDDLMSMTSKRFVPAQITVERTVQTTVMAKDYRFTLCSNLRNSNTQTQDFFFPYDDEVREKINNILGNKLIKGSDKAGHIYETFAKRVNESGSYKLASLKMNKNSKNALWPKHKVARKITPVRLNYKGHVLPPNLLPPKEKRHSSNENYQINQQNKDISHVGLTLHDEQSHTGTFDSAKNQTETMKQSPKNSYIDRKSYNPYGTQYSEDRNNVVSIGGDKIYLDRGDNETLKNNVSGQVSIGTDSTNNKSRIIYHQDGNGTGRFANENNSSIHEVYNQQTSKQNIKFQNMNTGENFTFEQSTSTQQIAADKEEGLDSHLESTDRDMGPISKRILDNQKSIQGTFSRENSKDKENK